VALVYRLPRLSPHFQLTERGQNFPLLREHSGIITFKLKTFNLFDFIHKAGKTTDNLFIKQFNGSFRDECLSAIVFSLLENAKEKIEKWQEKYNNFWPIFVSSFNARESDYPCKLANSSTLSLSCFWQKIITPDFSNLALS
jgi:hypothetical protein